MGAKVRSSFVYAIIVFSLIALACNAVTNTFDNLISDSPDSGVAPSGMGGPTRPVGFVNHGSYNAVVMPFTFVPLGNGTPAPPPVVSTISSVPTSPGLWPNPSRFLSLPFGTYTWCFEWDEGDLDNDSHLDYFHSLDIRPVTVDENSPDDHDLAIQVDFSTPPEGSEILSGPCGDQPVAVTGLGDPLSPTETPDGDNNQPATIPEPAPVDNYPHTYMGELKLITALGTCSRIDYFTNSSSPVLIETEENEIVLIVDEQGKITGTVKTRLTATHQGDSAGKINAEEYIGDCEGGINGTNGNLICSLTQQYFLYCDECGPPGFPINPFEASFNINISDNKIAGTKLDDEGAGNITVAEDCFSFVLNKQ